MQKLTKQILLKISPELNKSIDVAFSQYLKNTGEYITKAEFIRRAVESGYQTLLRDK
jgi:hypothetical protein